MYTIPRFKLLLKIRILYYVTDRLINNSLTDHFVNSYNVIIMIIIIMRNVASIADGRGAWLRLERQNIDVHINTSRHILYTLYPVGV